MKLEQNKFHKSFKLNGVSFSSVDEIFDYTIGLSDEIHEFLQSWFSADKSITVQTSGSTGIPKSILLKKEHILNSAKATGNYFGLQENTTALLCLSVKYIAGKLMLIRAITLGWELDVIESTSNPLEKVSQINGVTFDCTEDYIKENGGEDKYFVRKNDVGVIAQEIEKVLPQVVATREDGIKAVKYDRIVALLIESVKELKKEIEELKSGA